MEEFKHKVETALKTYAALYAAIRSGTRWTGVHLVALTPGNLYIVRRVFLDGTHGQPVAARWTFEHSWCEVEGILANEEAAGIEVWT